ncbi:MAG TPA: hypothetical protein VMT18_06085, partial [Planctomycetota bacterium]|nr:hypothetical protein [Planctomycetota bacterium]
MRNETAAGGPILFQVEGGGVFEGTAAVTWDVASADVDGDGRNDLLKAVKGANRLLLAVGGDVDTHAPRLALLEQPPDQNTNGLPLRIRVQVYDNAAEEVTAANETTLWYQVGTGPLNSVPMRWSGGQVFQGELPGSAQGLVLYFASSVDSNGNAGASGPKGIHTAGGCSGQPANFCSGLVNSAGCEPRINFQGAPSASAGSGFVVRAAGLVPNNVGLFVYSKSGPASIPFAGGILCVAPPILRTPGFGFGGGAPCGGMFQFDFNAYVATGNDPLLVAGADVWIQAWARDTAAALGVSLSNGLKFTLCP